MMIGKLKANFQGLLIFILIFAFCLGRNVFLVFLFAESVRRLCKAVFFLVFDTAISRGDIFHVVVVYIININLLLPI